MSNPSRSIILLIAGILIFAGLPLVAWGLDDLQGFAAQPARVGYVLLVVLVQAFVILRFPQSGSNQGEGKNTVERQRLAVILLQVLSLAVVIAAPFSDRRDMLTLSDTVVIRYIGLFLFALGMVGVSWAQASLGKQFSVQVTIQEGHQLITQGPYRLLRHPRYLGILIFSLGIALVFRSGLGLLLVLALLGVLLWRIQDEEALMSREFGSEWAAYSKKSWRLIPYLY